MRHLISLAFLAFLAACASVSVAGPNRIRFANAHLSWVQYESPNFTLISDVSEADANTFLQELEDFRGFARQTLGAIEGLRPRLIVIAPSTRAGFSVFADPDRIGGQYFRTIDTDFMVINLSVTKRNSRGLNGTFSANEILRHEYIHAVIADIPGKPLPTWLNEGFAEYFSTAEREGDHFVVGRPIDDRLRDLLSFKARSVRTRRRTGRRTVVRSGGPNASLSLQLASLETIVAADVASQVYRDTRDRTNFHAQAWLLVHRLYSTAEGRETLARYRQERARFGTEADTLTRVLGEDLDDFDNLLWELVRKEDFPLQSFAAPRRQQFEIQRIGPVSEAELWCNAGRFKGGSTNARTAKAVFRFALTKDPNNVCALSHLSKLESADGNFKKAEALFNRAQAQNGNDAFTPLSRAMLHFRRFAERQSSGQFAEDELQQGIDWAKRAIEADPTLPLSYIAHAVLLTQKRYSTPADQCDGLQSALMAEHLLPQGDPTLKRTTSHFYVKLGKLSEARERLSFYEAWTLDDEGRSRAQAQITLLDERLKLRSSLHLSQLDGADAVPIHSCKPS